MAKKGKYGRAYKTDRDIEICEAWWDDFVFTPLTFMYDKNFYQPDIFRRQDLSIRIDKNGTKYINLYQRIALSRLFYFHFYFVFDKHSEVIRVSVQKPKLYKIFTTLGKGFWGLVVVAGIMGLFINPGLFAGYWLGYIAIAAVTPFFWADWWVYIKPLWKTMDEFMEYTFGAYQVESNQGNGKSTIGE